MNLWISVISIRKVFYRRIRNLSRMDLLPSPLLLPRYLMYGRFTILKGTQISWPILQQHGLLPMFLHNGKGPFLLYLISYYLFRKKRKKRKARIIYVVMDAVMQHACARM